VVTHSAHPRAWLFAVVVAGVAACNSLLGNEDPTLLDAAGGDDGAGLEAGGGGQAPSVSGGGNSSGGRANSSGGNLSLVGGAGGDAAEAGGSAAGGEVTGGGAPTQPEGGSAGATAPGSDAPTVVSVTPEDDAVAVEPTATIEITFSEAMDEASVLSGISVSDGVNDVPGTVEFDGLSAVFTPSAALGLLATYTVSVSPDVTDAEGTPLAAADETMFTTRDGVWKPQVTLTNETGTIVSVTQFPTRPVIDAAGNALVVWSQEDTSDGAQSIWARAYSARAAWGEPFLVDESPFPCRAASVAMNSAGQALIVWSEAQAADQSSHRVMARRYLDGALEAAPAPVDDAAGAIPAELVAAVSETGDFHAFWARAPSEAPGLTYVYHSLAAASGAWTPDAAPVSTNFSAVHGLEAAFDPSGHGFVAWAGSRISQEIAVRRYNAGGGFVGEISITGSQGAFGRLALACDAGDNAVIAWIDGTDVKASHFSLGESWSEAELIEDRTGSPVENSVTVGVDGSTFLVGYGQMAGEGENAYVSSFDGTAWSASKVVNGRDRVTLDSRVTVGADAHGNALAVFVVQPMSDDGPNQQHVSFVRLPSGAGEWSDPLAISGVAAYDRASLDVAEHGSAIALWQTDDASYALHAAIFE
jgi:hypothetical protein